MKITSKISITLIVLLGFATAAFSQSPVLLDDFESGDKGWVAVQNTNWIEFEIVNNPQPNAVNPSAKVMKITRKPGSSDWAGIILRNKLALVFGALPEQYRFAKIKFLKTKTGDVTLKLEKNGDDGSHSATSNCSVANVWQEVTFDLKGASGQNYDDFFIQPAKTANLTANEIAYIDDIIFETDPNAELPEDDYELPGTFKLVWADEFNGTSYDTNIWSPQIAGNGFGNNELQYYTGLEKNIFMRDSCLVIKAYKENYGGRNYTSGKIWSQNKKYIKYGRVEARFKLPYGRGTWPAIWMMPQHSVYGGWPNSGEIDIMEFVGYDANRIYGTVHRGVGSGTKGNGNSRYVSNINDFHTIRIDWEPGYIKWYLDDQNFHTYVNAYAGSAQWPFDQEFYVILNLAVGGDWGGAQGIDPNIWPQEFLIDYVRVYQKSKSEESSIEIVKKDDDFKISLNENVININYLKNNLFDVVLYSISGQAILEKKSCLNTQSIDVSHLPQGVYLISIFDGEKSFTQKIIK